MGAGVPPTWRAGSKLARRLIELADQIRRCGGFLSPCPEQICGRRWSGLRVDESPLPAEVAGAELRDFVEWAASFCRRTSRISRSQCGAGTQGFTTICEVTSAPLFSRWALLAWAEIGLP